MSTNEKISDNEVVVIEEQKCYNHFIFLALLIIICLCVLLPLGFTYKHKSSYSTYEPNSAPIIYYPTSQPTYLHLRHKF